MDNFNPLWSHNSFVLKHILEHQLSLGNKHCVHTDVIIILLHIHEGDVYAVTTQLYTDYTGRHPRDLLTESPITARMTSTVADMLSRDPSSYTCPVNTWAQFYRPQTFGTAPLALSASSYSSDTTHSSMPGLYETGSDSESWESIADEVD